MSEDSQVFVSEKLPSQIHKIIRELKDDEKLCDFSIFVGQTEFRVHKLLLAGCSDYFKAMFLHNSLESTENKVCIQDISMSAMEAILNFCYTSLISLNTDNVQEILIAASIMQIHEVQNLCTKFIKCRIDISNCLGVLIVAERCNLSELYQSALCFCTDKFELISEENEFLQLDETWLSKIISNDQLNVDNEKKVFKAVVRWLSHDFDNRSPKLDDLMEHIRFPLIEPLTLVKLSHTKLVRNSLKCRDLIDEAKNFLLLQAYPEERAEMKGPRFTPRTSMRRQQRIFALGGWTNEYRPIATVERYNPYMDTWDEVSSMSRPRCGVGVAILGDWMYAIGGHDGQSYLKSAERYDLLGDVWHEDVADMKSERTSVGVVALNGYIYAIGGQVGSNPSANVERYDPNTNTWEECAPMSERRLGAGVTVYNELIFVCGGADLEPLATVECYDPIKNKWKYLAPMTTIRKHLGCTAYDGRIYAVGGRSDSSELCTAEYYDPKLDKWTSIPEMQVKRSGIGLVELDGLLFAVGGHNGDSRLKLVEAYDPINQVWTTKKPMQYERLGGGLAVYSKMHNGAISTTNTITTNQ